MKKYKTGEAIKMLEEGKAKEFKKGNFGIKNTEGQILFTKNNDFISIYGFESGEEWELVQKPVSFMEAITANGKIRVEHQLIEEYKNGICANETFRPYWRRFLSGEYMLSTQLLCVIGWMFKVTEVQEIIKEGKWYIEEGEND